MGGLGALVVAYSRHRLHEHENYRAELENRRAEAATGRENTKLLNGRFGAASAQLGHEKAAVRLAGAYASEASPTTGQSSATLVGTYAR